MFDLFHFQFPLLDAYSDLASSAAQLAGTALTNSTNKSNVNATNDTNLQIARETNAANIQIADQTNAANLLLMQLANQFSADQADLAYERSTAKSKLSELIQAGLSPEQAKQIIASQGSTSSATAATPTTIPAQGATMQGATMQAPQMLDFGPSAGAMGSALGALADSYMSDNGGVIGFGIAHEALQEINQNLDSIPVEALGSPHSFKSFIESISDENNPLFNFKNSKAWNKVKNSLPGFRSFMSAINQHYSDNADTAHRFALFQEQLFQAQCKSYIDQVTQNITDEQFIQSIYQTIVSSNEAIISDDNVTISHNNVSISNNDVALSNNAVTKDNILTKRAQDEETYVTQTDIMNLRTMYQQLSLNYKYLSDPSYRENICAMMLSNAAGAAMYEKWIEVQNSGLNQLATQQPSAVQALGIFGFMQSIGFGDTLAGNFFMQGLSAGITGSDMPYYINVISNGLKQYGYDALFEPNGDATLYYDAVEKMANAEFEAYISSEMKQKGIEIGVDVVHTIVQGVQQSLLLRQKQGYNKQNMKWQRANGGFYPNWSNAGSRNLYYFQ